MKTIVFLILLLSICVNTETTKAYQEGEYEILDSTVHISYDTTKTPKELIIEVNGMHNFTYTHAQKEEIYTVNNVTTDNTHIILYGFTLNKAQRTHDAFIIFLDTDGNLVEEVLFDDADLQEVNTHYNIGDTLIYRVRESIEDDGYKEVKNHFIMFEESLEEYNRHTFEYAIKRAEIIENKLCIAENYDGDYDGAIDEAFLLYNKYDIYGIINHGIYDDPIEVFVLNEGRLEDNVFNQHITVDYPGHYYLKYYNTTVTFTLKASVEGIEHDQVYHEPVSIKSKGRLLLNNKLYMSGETIEDPGHYTLIIEGVNDYEQRINFTIESQVDGVFNNQSYDTKRQLIFDGTGYLNNRHIQSGYIIEDPGVYTLEIIGENNYRNTMHFEITDAINDTGNKNVLFYMEVGLIVTAIIAGSAALIKMRIKT